MKKVKIIFLVIISIHVFIPLIAQEDTTFMEKREYKAIYVDDGDIIIDGEVDNAWDFADIMPIDHYAAGATVIDPTDLSGNAKICWNENGLFILVEMTDETVIKRSDYENPVGGEWEYDCVEIYTNNTGKRDANDVSYSNRAECIRINIGDEETQKLSGTIDTSLRIHNYQIKYPAGGYTVEFFLPFSYLKPDTVNLRKRWGFHIQVGDNDTEDDGTLHEVPLGWNSWAADGTPQSDQHWQNINYFGVLYLNQEQDTTICNKPEVTFYKKSDNSFTIDGNNDEWIEIDSTAFLGISENSETPDDEADLSGYFKGAWTNDGLYFYTHVNDESIISYQERYMMDCPCEGYDDFMFFFNPTGKRTILQPNNYAENKASSYTMLPGDEEWYDTLELWGNILGDFGKAPYGTYSYMFSYPDGGYTVESFFSWDIIKPEIKKIPERWGFSINIRDSELKDCGCIYESTLVWAGEGLGEIQWKDVNYLGVMHLKDITDNIQLNKSENQINIYPNPVKNIINFQFPDDNLYTIEIFTILGAKVYSTKITNNQSIDVAFLAKDTYIVKISGERYVRCEKLIIF